mmetsp:Transcript_70085/g.146137  ORF Transcript_70085/g.146137 Transcript_70085/m.146137 type:complete len:222 (+) Transcript_70085:754-1419(+)
MQERRTVFLSNLDAFGSNDRSSSYSIFACIRLLCSTSLWLSFFESTPSISNINSPEVSSPDKASSASAVSCFTTCDADTFPDRTALRWSIASCSTRLRSFLESVPPGTKQRSSSKYCLALRRRCCSTCLCDIRVFSFCRPRRVPAAVATVSVLSRGDACEPPLEGAEAGLKATAEMDTLRAFGVPHTLAGFPTGGYDPVGMRFPARTSAALIQCLAAIFRS